jgi:nitroreductase
MTAKLAQTQVPIHDILARRWSGRAFDPARKLAREQLVALCEAARWAASCYNDQPWRFLVFDRHSDAAAYQRAFGCLGEWNQKWVKNAPVLLIACANSIFDYNGKPNRWGQHDTGAAGQNLYLQATVLGLVAHPMGGFDADKVRQTFGVPEAFTPMAMVAVGYPAPAATLEGEYRDAELAPRERKPLGERFFEGAWGEPLKGS